MRELSLTEIEFVDGAGALERLAQGATGIASMGTGFALIAGATAVVSAPAIGGALLVAAGAILIADAILEN